MLHTDLILVNMVVKIIIYIQFLLLVSLDMILIYCFITIFITLMQPLERGYANH